MCDDVTAFTAGDAVKVTTGFLGDIMEHGKGCVLMQSTGLCDKNGVEIFEGDVVESDMTTPFIVTWDAERGGFGLRGHPISHYGANTWSAFTVIGNRFQNPKLLEES